MRARRWRACRGTAAITALLLAGDGPRSTILIGYLLLAAGSALRLRIALVWMVTLLSMVGYAALVADALWRRPHLVPSPRAAVPFLVGLSVTGLIAHLVLRRLGLRPRRAARRRGDAADVERE